VQGGLEEGGTTKGGGFSLCVATEARGSSSASRGPHCKQQMSHTAQHEDPGKGMAEEGKKKRRKEKEEGGW